MRNCAANKKSILMQSRDIGVWPTEPHKPEFHDNANGLRGINMRFDAILPSDLSHQEILELGKLGEDCGLGGVWVANNYATRDPFVNFVPLAMQSKKIRMGPIAVSPFELHPQKMAHSLLTLNEIAGGRAQIVAGIYSEPEKAIRLIGEHLVRALS